ncbi:hypothetical protein PUN28_017647 [Cardiocondyla obscurior]|uniref:Uncharacterized protein n=1 Tax=Cardiocondyla obscurior TaxID=286306 RepID=A0AAW2EJJ3_9HYME
MRQRWSNIKRRSSRWLFHFQSALSNSSRIGSSENRSVLCNSSRLARATMRGILTNGRGSIATLPERSIKCS